MRKLSVKAILSTLLILLFLFMAFTGALLYFGKTGMVLGFSRHALREAHFWVAVSMCVFIPVHLILNMRIYLTELRAVGRKSGIRNSEFGIKPTGDVNGQESERPDSDRNEERNGNEP